MADKKISQLTAASQVNSDAVFPLSQIVSGSDATVKATVGQVGDYIADEQTFAGLNTSAKDLIGAINEIAAGGGGSVPSVAIHPGKINLNNGTIEADNDYFYTDLFDAPNGNFIFDLGESSNSNYIGVEMCASNGSHVNYWSASSRFREANHAQYYSQAPKFRLSFRAVNLSKIVLMYKVGDQVYSNYDFHTFGSGSGGIYPISLVNNCRIGVTATDKVPSPIDANNYIDISGNTVTLKRNNYVYHLWIYSPRLLEAGKAYAFIFDGITNFDENYYIEYTSDITTNPIVATRIGYADSNNIINGFVIKPTVSAYYGVAIWSNNTNDIVVNNPRFIEIG